MSQKFNPDAPAYACDEILNNPRIGDYVYKHTGFTKRERLIESAMKAQIKSTGGFDPLILVKQIDKLIDELNK